MFEITINSGEIGFLWISNSQRFLTNLAIAHMSTTSQPTPSKTSEIKGIIRDPKHTFSLKRGTMFEEGKIY